MVAGICAILTNTCLNFLLIFGIGPFPELGVSGAAIATVISRFLQIAIIAFWTHKNRERLIYPKGLYRSFRVPGALTKRIMKKGFIPLVLNETLWGAGMAMLTQCYSVRGIDVVAGLNISTTVVNLFNVMFIAIGVGISVILGQMLGGGEFEAAKDAAPRLIAFSALTCVGVGAVMASLSWLFPMAYNTSDGVREFATAFIIVSAIFTPLHGMAHSTYFTLRSGGKTGITFLFDSGYTWVVAVPFAFFLSRYTNLHIFNVYFLCQGVEILKCMVGAYLVKKNVWISNIVAG